MWPARYTYAVVRYTSGAFPLAYEAACTARCADGRAAAGRRATAPRPPRVLVARRPGNLRRLVAAHPQAGRRAPQAREEGLAGGEQSAHVRREAPPDPR